MKTKLIKTLGAFLMISSLTACGADTTETKAQTDKSEAVQTEKEKNPKKEKTLCFEFRNEKVDGVYSVWLNFDGDDVTGSYSNIEYEGNGEGRYEGIRKGDTLFLKDIFGEIDGEKLASESLWLLKGDKLYMVQTVAVKGKLVVTNPAKPEYLLSYKRINCK
jgi:hypothetical protein